MKEFLAGLLIFICAAASADNSLCAPVAAEPEIKQAVKWYRNSAEQTALYHQAFNLGQAYIANWVAHNKPKAHAWGVILDIDETTLDNSWYFQQCGELANDEDDFSHYVANQQKSVALPGVKDLVNQVHHLGGYVSLVSNRDGSFHDASGSVLDSTIANLHSQGIYFDQVVLANRKTAPVPSDKNPRFTAVITANYDAKQMAWSTQLPAHQVIAYFGDNIQDFPRLKQNQMYKLDRNSASYSSFGAGYFILPNPMYGSWQANANN